MNLQTNPIGILILVICAIVIFFQIMNWSFFWYRKKIQTLFVIIVTPFIFLAYKLDLLALVGSFALFIFLNILFLLFVIALNRFQGKKNLNKLNSDIKKIDKTG